MRRKNGPFSAFLFDLDGVVVFTDRYHYLGWKKLADEQGWQFDEEVNHGCRGVPRMASLEVILRHNGVELAEPEKEELAARKNRYYVELLGNINEADLYPGAVDFLKKVREAGLQTALCSSSRNAHRVLEALDLGGVFDAVVTGADIERPKPDPEIFLLGAKRLGVEPSRCLVFEDAESGVEAALAAGMDCIGVGEKELLPRAPATMKDYASLDFAALVAGDPVGGKTS